MPSPLKIVSVNKEKIEKEQAVQELAKYLGEKWERKMQKKIDDWRKSQKSTVTIFLIILFSSCSFIKYGPHDCSKREVPCTHPKGVYSLNK